MNTSELTYDYDGAVRFIQRETSVPAGEIEAVLEAKDRYHYGLGIIPDGTFADLDPKTIRAEHDDLFPSTNIAARYVGVGLELEYVVRTTGLTRGIAARVLEADMAYMRLEGIAVDASPSQGTAS